MRTLELRIGIVAQAAMLALPAAAGGLPDACRFRCTLDPPKPNCAPTVRVLDLGQWIDKSLTQEVCSTIQAKVTQAGLCAKLILRPHGESWKLLTTNPHPRHDAHVCQGHEVRLYVGVRPWIEMPDLGQRPADEAMRELTKAWRVSTGHRSDVPFEARCLHSNSRLDPALLTQVQVVQQWPAPAQRLYGLQESVSLDRLDVPRQTAIVWVIPTGSPNATGQATPCALPTQKPETVTVTVTVPVPVPEVHTRVVERSTSSWWLPALGGAGAAAAAGALLRGGGQTAPLPPRPTPPAPTAAPRVMARVRPVMPGAEQGESETWRDG